MTAGQSAAAPDAILAPPGFRNPPESNQLPIAMGGNIAGAGT